MSGSAEAPATAGGAAVMADVVPKVLRVSQLDALELDGQVYSMLGGQLRAALRWVEPSVALRFRPELDALVRWLVVRYTLLADRPTPGALVMNLQYTAEGGVDAAVSAGALAGGSPAQSVWPSRSQKVLYVLLEVVGRWAWTRLEGYSIEHGFGEYQRGDWRRRVASALRVAERVYRVAAVVNFGTFLVSGRYRSLLDRATGLRLAYRQPRQGRQIMFEFMNQQLIWRGFSDFLLFFLPLISLPRIRQLVAGVWRASVPSHVAGDHGEQQHQPHAQGASSCPVCSAEPITTPFSSSCGHVFCYYCLAGSRAADERFCCPRCGERSTGMWRFRPPS